MSRYAAAAHCASVGAALKLEPSIVFEGVRMKHYWAVDEALSNISIATLITLPLRSVPARDWLLMARNGASAKSLTTVNTMLCFETRSRVTKCDCSARWGSTRWRGLMFTHRLL